MLSNLSADLFSCLSFAVTAQYVGPQPNTSHSLKARIQNARAVKLVAKMPLAHALMIDPQAP